jgi:excinuclease ABC subunit C
MLPEEPGVYRFRDAGDRILYVGRAVNLRRRVASYWGDLGDRSHLAAMVPVIAGIEAIACDSEHEAAWLERNVLERELPPWNRTRGGEESPVHILLDASAGSPGLKVAHLPRTSAAVRCFGPYLGGAKVRLAVAALHRVLPLAYTGDSLTPAEAEMGRLRRIDRSDRNRLSASVAAVLERDAPAVSWLRAELTRRRDDAADSQAYELAGRLQAELAAVDWIVAPQRVTSMAAADHDFCGWAGGIEVHFEVRAGRLCDWRRQSSVRSRSGASGPKAWAGFARRNAALAAALAQGPYQSQG